MGVHAVEITNRGVYQYNLGRRISRDVVLAARKMGRVGVAFGRYSDSPERNGIPMKWFAVIADTDDELEEQMAKYYPEIVDAAVVLDDSLLKGVESWSWDGLHPANERVKEKGVMIVVSNQSQDELLKDVHTKDLPYKLITIPGEASFSGMWIIRDDKSEARIMGALAAALPDMISPDSVQQIFKDKVDQDAAERAAKQMVTRVVEPGEGNPAEPYRYELPVWQDLTEYGITVVGMGKGGGYHGGKEGYEPTRSTTFRKHLSRTSRPVTDFDRCTQTRDCWLNCPDEAYNVTPDGYFEVDYGACSGCGKCVEVCPEKCISMIPESEFEDEVSVYDAWKKDTAAYKKFFEAKAAKGWVGGQLVGPHGYVRKGQYDEEIKKTGIK